MKLTLPDNADWDAIRETAARAKNPAWDNKQLLTNLLAFVDHWVSEGCAPYSLDSRVFVKSPGSIRQDFFNIKNALKNNPAMMEHARSLYASDKLDALFHALEEIRFKVKDEFLLIHRGIDQATDNPFLAAARPITAATKRSLKSRLADWLEGDMDKPFEATGEAVDDELETQLKVMLAGYEGIVAYAITSSSVIARKI